MNKVNRIAIAALIFGTTSVPTTAAGENAAPVTQEIAVTLVPAEHLLQGETTVIYAASPGNLSFTVNPAAHIDAVTTPDRTIGHTFHDGTITVIPAPVGEPLSITIRYSLVLNDPLPRQGAGTEDPGYGVSGSIGPQGAFLDGSAGWYPRPSAAPQRRTIRITAPAGMEGVTAGERLNRETTAGTTRSAWREEPPVGELSLAAGPYRVTERTVSGILISTYLYPENAHLAEKYLEAAGMFIKRYSELFGPYPFPKFAVVENFFPTGYGFPSFTLLGSTVIRLPFIVTTSLPHEIAHNWWGNGVLVDPSQGNWCEGLVTYVADYLQEEKKGEQEARDYRLRLLSDFSLLVPPQQDFPLSRFTSRTDPASRAIGYGKSAMVWHMLRRRVGDQAFFATLKEVFRDKCFKRADWGDFGRALSRRSGIDLDPFLKTWLDRPGGPILKLADVQHRRQDDGWVVAGTVVQTQPTFPLQLPLRLETELGKIDEVVPLNGDQARFRFITTASPRRLLVDPEADIFRLLAGDQLPANINRIKGSKGLVGVVASGCGDGAMLKRLLESIGQEDVKVITEEELAQGAGRSYDLVVCGLPKEDTALFDLPGSIEASDRSFTVGNERFSAPLDLLFLVARQRNDPERVAALLLPLSPRAGETAIAKITHYGNYGVLVFSEGANRHKLRAVQESAADQVRFPEPHK